MVVIAPAFGVALWHGGFTRGGQLAFAAIAFAGVAWFRPRPQAVDVALVGGLAAVALANLASLAWNRGDSSTAAALAATALPLLVVLGAAARPALVRWLPLIVLALGLATATAGLAGLALRSPPLAERIAGVWRAGGTFEYPPALGLFCVCALAFALALHAAGRLDRLTAVVSGAVLTAAAVATFDRVTWLETAAVLAVFAVRVPALRRAIWPVVAAAAACALAGAGRLAPRAVPPSSGTSATARSRPAPTSGTPPGTRRSSGPCWDTGRASSARSTRPRSRASRLPQATSAWRTTRCWSRRSRPG